MSALSTVMTPPTPSSLSTVVYAPNPRELPPRIPRPRHRHAAPSGPWPWMKLGAEYLPFQIARPPENPQPSPGPWNYPQALFPNWLPQQVARSGITTKCLLSGICSLYRVDVLDNGAFLKQETCTIMPGREEAFWETMQDERPRGIRVRGLFIENLTLPVLQMLGTKYNIEPFFFSSSLNFIPSRYQEEVRPGKGDHITISLTFIRTIPNPMTAHASPVSANLSSSEMIPQLHIPEQIIDTQAPLCLRSTDNILLLDLLAIHLVRTTASSTIISYHPDSKWSSTSARQLHSLVCVAGQSVYWQKIFQKSKDPTFLLLAILWYALYAWDEALDVLYGHIVWLETRVISPDDIHRTRELHIIRAHLLHYASLLQDFRKSVTFVMHTPNPAMDCSAYDPHERQDSENLLKKECENLLSEIDRLEASRVVQENRLKNVMELAFATVNIEDSKYMRKLTEAAVRDSAAMKQISYLTMVFLPASFVSGVFGMNIKELGTGNATLAHYAETALAFTAGTVWMIIAFQVKSPIHEEGRETPFWLRLLWPIMLLNRKLTARWKNVMIRKKYGIT